MSQRNTLSLNQQQRQQQTLSPQQVRYFRMLEMNQTQAEEELKHALDENPALEIADTSPSENGENDFNETAEEMQLADYAGEDDIPTYQLRANNRSADDSDWHPEAIEEAPTLFDIIVEQARMLGLDDDRLAALIFVAGNLDNNGYLTRSTSDMAADMTMVTGREISQTEINEALTKLRTLDPAGIGASDLRQCLLLQLRRKKPTPDIEMAIEVIAHNFDLFSHKHYDRLASAVGIDRERLRRVLDIIRSLNPKPGSEVESVQAADRLSHITPDFAVETDGESLTVTLLNAAPELRVEATFAADDDGNSSSSADAFIRRQRDEALGFISILKLRQQTLFRVMNAIARFQQKFFLTGDEAKLRPMVLKDISQSTGYDTSVVSRATQGKYVLTPWGIFSLKFFFNERFNDSDDTSSREIIAALREIVEGEDRRHPLNDDAVAEQLSRRGFKVARRTVAKYREQAGIPVARLRREL